MECYGGGKKMKQGQDFNEAVKKYWEDPATVSIIDQNLHKLEIDIVLRYLKSSDCLADIGCGDGRATLEYARKARKCTGYERSNTLRKKARACAEASGLDNIEINNGDILAMTDFKDKFNFVVTQRVLINLGSWSRQKQAIMNIHKMLKKGGTYVMIENTNDAFDALNDMRAEVGLGPIPLHWHNRFFDYKELLGFLKGKFNILKVHDFGLYYFLTRVYAQMFAPFKGFGKKAVKDPLFARSDKAARIIHEKFNDRIKIEGCRALGPIQAFILKKA